MVKMMFKELQGLILNVGIHVDEVAQLILLSNIFFTQNNKVYVSCSWKNEGGSTFLI